jgi:hypothetical protein
MPICHQCGQEFEIDETGVSTHVFLDGSIDHDRDADHVPYELPQDSE